MKSKRTAYILWLFFGLLGVHKFYLNKTGLGILYMFTAGLFFIGWIIDLFTLGKQVDQYNANPPKKAPKGISMYQEWVDRYNDASDEEIKDTLFIEYKDTNGAISERYIKIQKVNKSKGITYIHAFCFLHVEERTFRAERIVSLMDKPGQKIKDIPGFLNAYLKKPSPSSAADLAQEAAK